MYGKKKTQFDLFLNVTRQAILNDPQKKFNFHIFNNILINYNRPVI